jgi:hypothetical protein
LTLYIGTGRQTDMAVLTGKFFQVSVLNGPK